MIYEAMKGLVEGLVDSYKCECGSGVSEKNIDIVGAAGNTVNFDLVCPKCGKHGIVKSQIMIINQDMKDSIENIKEKLIGNNSSKQISDIQITNLRKDLKEKQINVSDLFS